MINNGEKIITSSGDSTAVVTEVETKQKIYSLEGHSEAVYSIAVNSPLEDKLATGSFDHTVRIWNLLTGELINDLTGHDREVVSLAFSYCGSLLASCDMDRF